MNNSNLYINCSTYNPCGRFGHCENDIDGQWRCVCTFWWNGTVCNSLTSSGKQVVALGILTGLFIGFYYGLYLFNWLKNKRKKHSQNTISLRKHLNLKPYQQINETSKSSNKIILSWITGISTIILTIIILLIRWSIIKNIHNQIINKYKNNQPLFYVRPSACDVIYIRGEFNMLTIPVSCLLIILFIILTKRQSFYRNNNYYSAYFGIPIPLDFFSGIKRRFIAVVFAIVADDLTNIALQLFDGEISLNNEGIIITYLFQIIRVLSIGLRYYPILSAVHLNTKLTLICASIYSWFDLCINIAFNNVCRNNYYANDKNYNKTDGERTIFYLKYYGQGSKLIFIQLITDIPRYLCISFVSIRLLILVYKCLKDRNISLKELTREQEILLYSSLPNSYETKYVQNLFGLTEQFQRKNRLKQFLTYIYQWRDDFRFSTRVVCVYSSIFILLIFVTVQACVQGPPYLSDYPHIVVSYLLGVFIALILIIVQLSVLLVSIRRNLLQAFRGDNLEIPRRDSSQNVNYALANIHFAGYLIGNVLWGYFLIAIFTILIGVLIDLIVIYKWIRFIEYVLKLLIPPILFALFQNYLNKILGEYVFLQNGGKILSIKHRRILILFLYFNFYLDALLGLISSIVRVLKSVIGGIIYMCRIDYSVFGRKLEIYDGGFSSYCGFIHMECVHRHPVLLYFTSILLRQHFYEKQTTKLSKARLRWDLTIFLLKNPKLIYHRKFSTQQSETKIFERQTMETFTIQ